tara:strand:- start:1533 stop:1817 length:285 start_codon:yes stop_codon:yes gene_type:complete
MSAWYTCDNDTVIVNLYVQPGAKRTEVVGLHGDELKIRLTSQPIDGRANDALLNFVAKTFDVPRRKVALIRGGKSRHKKIVITGSKIEPPSIFS